ncbi:hypothetical protein PCE1_000076 [Barthelona sp. PCE]
MKRELSEEEIQDREPFKFGSMEKSKNIDLFASRTRVSRKDASKLIKNIKNLTGGDEGPIIERISGQDYMLFMPEILSALFTSPLRTNDDIVAAAKIISVVTQKYGVEELHSQLDSILAPVMPNRKEALGQKPSNDRITRLKLRRAYLKLVSELHYLGVVDSLFHFIKQQLRDFEFITTVDSVPALPVLMGFLQSHLWVIYNDTDIMPFLKKYSKGLCKVYESINQRGIELRSKQMHTISKGSLHDFTSEIEQLDSFEKKLRLSLEGLCTLFELEKPWEKIDLVVEAEVEVADITTTAKEDEYFPFDDKTDYGFYRTIPDLTDYMQCVAEEENEKEEEEEEYEPEEISGEMESEERELSPIQCWLNNYVRNPDIVLHKTNFMEMFKEFARIHTRNYVKKLIPRVILLHSNNNMFNISYYAKFLKAVSMLYPNIIQVVRNIMIKFLDFTVKGGHDIKHIRESVKQQKMLHFLVELFKFSFFEGSTLEEMKEMSGESPLNDDDKFIFRYIVLLMEELVGNNIDHICFLLQAVGRTILRKSATRNEMLSRLGELNERLKLGVFKRKTIAVKHALSLCFLSSGQQMLQSYSEAYIEHIFDEIFDSTPVETLLEVLNTLPLGELANFGGYPALEHEDGEEVIMIDTGLTVQEFVIICLVKQAMKSEQCSHHLALFLQGSMNAYPSLVLEVLVTTFGLLHQFYEREIELFNDTIEFDVNDPVLKLYARRNLLLFCVIVVFTPKLTTSQFRKIDILNIVQRLLVLPVSKEFLFELTEKTSTRHESMRALINFRIIGLATVFGYHHVHSGLGKDIHAFWQPFCDLMNGLAQFDLVRYNALCLFDRVMKKYQEDKKKEIVEIEFAEFSDVEESEEEEEDEETQRLADEEFDKEYSSMLEEASRTAHGQQTSDRLDRLKVSTVIQSDMRERTTRRYGLLTSKGGKPIIKQTSLTVSADRERMVTVERSRRQERDVSLHQKFIDRFDSDSEDEITMEMSMNKSRRSRSNAQRVRGPVLSLEQATLQAFDTN